MALDFKFPDVGEGIHEATLVEWLVKPGDPIAADTAFAKVETDKAVVELPAPRAGIVLALHAKPGDTIKVGQVIAVFGDAGETAPAPAVAPAPAAAPAPISAPPPAAAPAAAAPTGAVGETLDFKFPDVGEGIHEATLVEWLVKPGEGVKADQAFVKVETDKAVVELPAPRAGFLVRAHVAAGQIVKVGQVLATFAAAPGATQPASVHAPSPPPAAAAPVPAAAVATAAVPTARTPGLPALATPRTRALARKLGVDINAVAGTGTAGRITDDDVQRAARGGVPQAAPAPIAATAPAGAAPPVAAPKPATVPVPAPVTTAPGVAFERRPISNLRKVIAQNMRLSRQVSAHVTHVDEADVTELLAAQKKLKAVYDADQPGLKFSLLPLFLKAAVAVLKKHPVFNASFDETTGELVYKYVYNIGIAVDTPEGLVVPVLKNVDKKSPATLAAESAELALKARERRLSLDDLRDGTFTLTNLGPIGGLFATPIIRQPELAIVGTHTIREVPAVVDGQIAIRKRMYLSVSFDHRIIDGAAAARFMNDLIAYLQEPVRLLTLL